VYQLCQLHEIKLVGGNTMSIHYSSGKWIIIENHIGNEKKRGVKRIMALVDGLYLKIVTVNQVLLREPLIDPQVKGWLTIAS
jgi:hypothetical protein